jgi:hypothetical protein
LSDFFSSSHGLRQGDPLSPLHFVIVMEASSRMLCVIVDEGVLLSCFVGSRHFGVVNISHLLFADDTLVCCEATPNHLRYVGALLLQSCL